MVAAGANLFGGGYLDGGATINDGAGGVITLEAKANALAAYQNKLVITTGHGTRSFPGTSFKGLDALPSSLAAKEHGGLKRLCPLVCRFTQPAPRSAPASSLQPQPPPPPARELPVSIALQAVAEPPAHAA